MKLRDQRKEIHEASQSELRAKLVESREEEFKLRFQLRTNQLTNPMKLRASRQRIARIETEISHRQKGATA